MDGVWKKVIVLMLLASVLMLLDATTTFVLVSNGYPEGNPISKYLIETTGLVGLTAIHISLSAVLVLCACIILTKFSRITLSLRNSNNVRMLSLLLLGLVVQRLIVVVNNFLVLVGVIQ